MIPLFRFGQHIYCLHFNYKVYTLYKVKRYLIIFYDFLFRIQKNQIRNKARRITTAVGTTISQICEIERSFSSAILAS